MMPKRVDLQIRGVPLKLRDRLRARARSKGRSMTQYVIELIEDDLARPTMKEWLEDVLKNPPLKGHRVDAVKLVREGRRDMGWTD